MEAVGLYKYMDLFESLVHEVILKIQTKEPGINDANNL